MTYVLVGEEDRSIEDAAGIDSIVNLPPRSGDGGGHYSPASLVSAAAALRWVAYDEALSSVRALLSASHEDLRDGAHLLSRALSRTFFDRAAAAAAPIAAVSVRFPEGGLYVCADLPPLAPALRDVQRALVQVSVKDASHGSCDCFFDVVGHAMHLLVGDAGNGLAACGSVVFGRDTFESAFALEWMEDA